MVPRRPPRTADATSLPDRVRDACGWVAGRARAVRIDRDRLAAYAHTLPDRPAVAGSAAGPGLRDEEREKRASLTICLDAINYGSGWWPTIRKRPAMSGYHTVAAGIHDRWKTSPWTAGELAHLSAADVATALGQDPGHPLMNLFAGSLRDVGEHVRDAYGESFSAVVDAAAGSAVALAELLAEWQSFVDTSRYDGQAIPFFKRAQITGPDLVRAGVTTFHDEHRLTAFADNLVPHLLRVDGVLALDERLAARIDAGELLEHGSPEEVELRACGVHAVELLSRHLDGRLSPSEVDFVLWNRGQEPRSKAVPRPRCRTTAY